MYLNKDDFRELGYLNAGDASVPLTVESAVESRWVDDGDGVRGGMNLKVGNATGLFDVSPSFVDGWMTPGFFYLVSTAETVSVPDNCIGFVMLKHEIAMQSLCLSSPIGLNPGFKGIVKLPLSCLVPYKLEQGALIAKLYMAWFHLEVNEPVSDSFLK